MAKLLPVEKLCFEKLFGMRSGYVLDFTDATFAEFFRNVVSIDIEDPKYLISGGSKAKRLRAFWELEPDRVVAAVLREMLALWAYRQNESGLPVDDANAAHCRNAITRLEQHSLTEIGSTASSPAKQASVRRGPRIEEKVMKRLFVSHSSKDKAVAKVLVDLLKNGIGVPKDDILCTSLPGYKLEAGEGVNETLREHLQTADIVLLLVTQYFWDSRYSLCELGAAWALAKKPIPLLVAPLSYDDLKEVVSGVHALKLDRDSDDSRACVNDLQDMVTRKLGLAQPTHNHWESERKDFFNALDKVFSERDRSSTEKEETPKSVNQAAQPKVTKATVDLDLAASREASTTAGTGTTENDEEDESPDVDSTDAERYERLVGEVRAALKQLPNVVVSALYYDSKDKPFRFEPEERNAVDDAVDEGMLQVDDEGAHLRTKDPEVRKALSALHDLVSWLGDSESLDLRRQIEEETGSEPDITIKGYWRDTFKARF